MGIRITVLVATAVAAALLTRAVPSPRAEPAARCDRPRALHLVRFEDGSAQLRCARRLLFRVTVPG